MFPALPEAHPRWDGEARREAAVLALHRSIAVWAAAGFDLIADGSLPYGSPGLRSACLRALAPSGMFLVGVRCAPAVLAERERARADRQPGWAVRQSYDIHDGLQLDADVDTSSAEPGDCARRVIAQLQEHPGWPTATDQAP